MKLKVGILTIICALAMVMPVMAAPYVSYYYGPIGTTIIGDLSVNEFNVGSIVLSKSLNILTTTGKTVDQILVKYEIQGKDGKLANVHDNKMEYAVGNSKKTEINWKATSSELSGSYTVFATHEMMDNGISYAVYTSIGL